MRMDKDAITRFAQEVVRKYEEVERADDQLRNVIGDLSRYEDDELVWLMFILPLCATRHEVYAEQMRRDEDRENRAGDKG